MPDRGFAEADLAAILGHHATRPAARTPGDSEHRWLTQGTTACARHGQPAEQRGDQVTR